MVGYTFSLVTPPPGWASSGAYLDFPRMVHGHEPAARLLVEKALETLKGKGVSRVESRLTTMCPGDIALAEEMGFSISQWGYKVYYSYEMAWGKPPFPGGAAEEIDPARDLGECAQIATRWYRRPSEWCLAHLGEWHKAGIITHLAVREQGRIVAACMAAANDVRPSTAAIYYIYTPDERCLKPMLAKVIARCVDSGMRNVIADLIGEHRPYERVYRELGFEQVASWARCEKRI